MQTIPVPVPEGTRFYYPTVEFHNTRTRESGTSRISVAYILNGDKIAFAAGFTSEADNFSRARGRHLAVSRLISRRPYRVELDLNGRHPLEVIREQIQTGALFGSPRSWENIRVLDSERTVRE
jgi:hypothetical protein